jgi:hypothetical protein
MKEHHPVRRFIYSDFLAGIGTLAGAIGGYYLGQELKDYVPFLKNAPHMIQYTASLASVLTGAELTARVSSKAGDLVARVINLFD